jgi:glycosyltransferase involved in cell wall biosynthesis
VDSVAAVDVAVVIPNHNGARWLPGVLDSVAAQTVAPAEVLVVDDGSTDASRALLAERFPGVRVLALGANAGFARAANAGTENSPLKLKTLKAPPMAPSRNWRRWILWSTLPHVWPLCCDIIHSLLVGQRPKATENAKTRRSEHAKAGR